MNLDQPVCLCFHVTRRKLENFIRIEKPRRAGQLSECFGAGTGCGWCRPFLVRLFQEQVESSESEQVSSERLEISAADYARQRDQYIQNGGGRPPAGSGPEVGGSGT